MPSKILEKIVGPNKIVVGSTFLLKIKVQFIQSYQLVTETYDNIITEAGDIIITEGDFYE